uniref:IQ motif and ubiquitin domain containing n=1 Tax=Gasterosteus aculeatus aculeatus TaxID=481459 RepID=A0AAQ4RE81_GASAC
MSEQRGNEETNLQPGAGAPPEDDREPGGDGHEEQAGRSTTGEPQADHQVREPPGGEGAGSSAVTDVPEEEAEARSALQDEAEPRGGEDAGSSTATVKVVLVPGGHVMTVAFAIGLRVQELKLQLAAELRVPAEVLQISLDGKVVEEQWSLMELGVQPQGSTRMEMSSTDPTAHPLRPLCPPERDNVPDVITVRVQTDNGVSREVVVEIERPPQQKAFLGGYRHRLTEVEYHHAAAQTPPKRRSDRELVVFSRDTQIAHVRSRALQCPVDVATQMTAIGCHISCKSDRLVAVHGAYITAEEYHGARLRAVIRLQAFARRWLAWQQMDRLRKDRDQRLAWLELQERRRKWEKEEQLRDHRRCQTNPQRRKDFELLYHALERWRREEEQRISMTLQGVERKVALCSLLEQETKLISSIEEHRAAAREDGREQAVISLLDKSAAPHQWRAADGRMVSIENEHTIRARELRDLYEDISRSSVSREQRLHVLLTLKHTMKVRECQLTRDVVGLIDREVDLMTRGVKAASLEGLRKRISTLFLQYIKTPAFNPEVAKLLKNASQLKNGTFLCGACSCYLLSSDFSLAAGARPRGRCRNCINLDNIARSRKVFFCYEKILRRLRADEQRLNREAKIPFLLQVEDLQYLVEVVWESRSALQASSDIYDLVLVRWERRTDWSPWNCILLSKDAAPAHLEVEDVHKAYEATFILSIQHKHVLARRHFSQLSVMAEHLDPWPPAPLGYQLVSKTSTVVGCGNTERPWPADKIIQMILR